MLLIQHKRRVAERLALRYKGSFHNGRRISCKDTAFIRVVDFDKLYFFIFGPFMLTADLFYGEGELSFLLHGPCGPIEAILTRPRLINTNYIALLGHPHSLQGGTMNNKVVTTLARLFKELGIASLRFNFRGVGQSAGVYDAGIGESEDMLWIARQCIQALPQAQLLFAGFSFGSYVAYRAASRHDHAILITVAPAVHHYNYIEALSAPKPWILVHGEEDTVVPWSDIVSFLSRISAPMEVLRFEGTGHFFHGQLLLLKTRLSEAIRHHLEWL